LRRENLLIAAITTIEEPANGHFSDACPLSGDGDRRQILALASECRKKLLCVYQFR
jgi:hypothetical protein